MVSKKIRITEEVYKKLMEIKGENESFSYLFLRLIKGQKYNIEKSFSAWDLSNEEMKGIWGDINTRSGRHWKKSDIGDL